jgi:hypothetical protein
MTDDRTLERAARSWLEQGPIQAPDHAVDAALSRIQLTPQERDLRIPWRFPTMNPVTRIAGLAAALVVAIGIVFVVLRPAPSVGPAGPTATPGQSLPASPVAVATPTVKPTVSATASPRPTLSPLRYTQTHSSAVYHYATKYPDTWTLSAGTSLDEADFIPGVGTSMDDFYGDGFASGVMVTAGPLSLARPALASWTPFITGAVESQFGSYIELANCVRSTRTLTVDGEPANEVDWMCPGHDWLWVTTVHAGRAYQIVWLDDGGFDAAYLRPFLDEFLSYFTFTK